MAHVFISYKREDRAFVSILEEKVKEAGIDTWTDAEINAGENWRTRIDSAIREAFVLVVVVTPELKNSEYVTYEWSFAMGLGIPILPIILRGVEKLHPKLDELHHFNFTRPYEEPWTELINQILNWHSKQMQLKIPDDAPIWAREALMALGHWNPAQRELALRALGRKKYLPALSAIIQILRDDNDEDVREQAITALSHLGSPEAIMPILEVIGSNDKLYERAIRVVYNLGKNASIPPEASPYLITYAKRGHFFNLFDDNDVLDKSDVLSMISQIDSVEAKEYIKKRREAEEAQEQELKDRLELRRNNLRKSMFKEKPSDE